MCETVTITIDDETVETTEGKSVLAAALEAGICIPNLCYLPETPPTGACRVCIVEVEKNGRTKMTASCTLEAKEGMVYVATKANASLVPVGVDGTDLFPGSLKRLRRAPVTIRFGRAFRLRTEGRPRIPRAEMHHMTREIMYQLASLLPEQRRGFYRDLDQMTTDYLDFFD